MNSTAPSSVTRPRRVVHVTFGLDVGGLERLLLEIGRRTDPKRIQLFFVTLGINGPIGVELRELGWTVVSLNRPYGFRPSLVFALARMFHGVRASAVHTHDPRALIYGAPAARLARVRRVVHTQHGQNLGMSSRQLMLMRFAAKRTDDFVCVSRDSARIAADQGVALSRLRTIYNGIDIGRFSHLSSHFSARARTGPLVTVARLSEEKDVSTLLKAVAIASREITDLKLEIAGEGPCRTALEREAEELGIQSRIEFLGQVPDSAEVLGRARLFVLPSVSEGVSLTLLEAAAAGTPAIATNVGGTPEIVQDELTGVLVPPRDPHALAGEIVRLWNNDALRTRLGVAAQEHAAGHFDISNMLGQYEELYGEPDSPNKPFGTSRTHFPEATVL